MKIIDNPNYYASIGNIMLIYASFDNNWDSLFKRYSLMYFG